MTNSIHLQNFPDLSFLSDEKKLTENMDFVRLVCSACLSIRDNKNLRVRLPLNSLTIIGKNVTQLEEFKEIIADEINVKNIYFEEKIDDLAEMKLQLNFKKIGAKFGSKIKEITTLAKENKWQKISENEIAIAGEKLTGDDFELKLVAKNNDEKKYAIAPLQGNQGLVKLDIEITKDLEEEGISRDIVRAIQQSRKDANLDVSDKINLKIFSKNSLIVEIAKKFSTYIREQVLAEKLETVESMSEIENSCQFFFNSKIEDGDLAIGIVKQ